uniref:Putative zinc finger protein-like protein n=1 Tax=Antonospora locustae TaxID=278021 RepID=Q6E6E1_ANTLO|nr:putative zinc finger protein-like protein [Antonospora locustae]|eukprot:jgi/Antlo1/62/1255
MANVSKEDAEKFFLMLRNEKGNSRCFDCNKSGPTWISMRHAVFVCTECAAEHRAMGFRLKSMLLDTFTLDDFKRIRLGGNFSIGALSRSDKYNRLASYPGSLDRLVERSSDVSVNVESRAETPRPIVRQKLIPKLGRKIDRMEREAVPQSREELKHPADVKSTSVPKEELLINRKEYRVGESSRGRMGFGVLKMKKQNGDAK